MWWRREGVVICVLEEGWTSGVCDGGGREYIVLCVWGGEEGGSGDVCDGS